MRKRALLVAALAVVMAACGGGEDEPVTTETTETTQEVSSLVESTTSLATTTVAEEPATPDTTQAPDTATADDEPVTTADEGTTTTAVQPTGTPELTSDDIVTLRALGPVTLGMTVEEAGAAAGLALGQDFGRASTDNCYYVTAGSDLPGVAFMVVDGAVARIEINPPSVIATRSGVRIGTAEASVREVYPNNIQQANDAVSDGQALAFVPNDSEDADYRIYFAIEDGEVANYRMGIRPSVDNLLGCQG